MLSVTWDFDFICSVLIVIGLFCELNGLYSLEYIEYILWHNVEVLSHLPEG